MSTIDPEAHAGLQALRAGNAESARELLSRASAHGRDNAAVLLGLAQACLRLKDDAGSLAAIDRLLALNPQDPYALILRADHFAAAGDLRSAAAHYRAALRAAPAPEQLTSPLARELRRAQQICEQYALQYKSFLRARLGANGFDPARSSARFAQSIDIVLGEKRVFVQEPRTYYFPGLPQIQFFDRERLPWLDAVEAATDEIRAELQEVLLEPGTFAPYVQGDPNRPYNQQQGMLNNPSWSACYLWKNGEAVPENAARCPRTLRALREVPLARVPNRSPSILFSLLKPGARIPPHNGLVNTRLICHLPVLVPPGCTFRVGNETRDWRPGVAWAFDDTIEHEAWNSSDQTRVVLLFDIWRPELSDEERALVVALFESIDAYAGQKPEWEI